MDMVGKRSESEERREPSGRATLPEWHALERRRELDRQQAMFRTPPATRALTGEKSPGQWT
jgi:hypothetical protein